MKRLLIAIALVGGIPAQLQATDFDSILRSAQSTSGRWEVVVTRREQHWYFTSLSVSGNNKLNDNDLKHIADLHTLEHLRIPLNTQVSDQGCHYLETLENLRQLECFNIDEGTLQSLNTMPRSVTLSFLLKQNIKVTDVVLSKLKNCHNLTSLNLADTRIDDAALPKLASMDFLQELNLAADFSISDSGIARLGALKNLRSINIYSIGATGAMALRQLPRLENLRIGNCVSDEIDLSQFTSLKSLSLNNDYGAKVTLKMPPTLQRLEVGQYWVSKPGRISAESLPKSINTLLVNLPAQCSPGEKPTGPSDLSWLSAVPALRDLTLTEATIDDIKRILSIEELQGLRLDGLSVSATDEYLRNLTSLKNLDTLSVQNCQQFACGIPGGITDAGLDVLSTLNKLRHLDLNGLARSKVTPAGLANIWKLKELNSLTFDVPATTSEPSIDDAFVGISALSNLQELTIVGGITDKTLESVGRLKKLRRLDLTHAQGYTEGALANIVKILPELQTVAWTCFGALPPPAKPRPVLEPTPEQKTQIDKLILELADGSFEVRAAAKLGLLRIGPVAESQLRKTRQETHDADVRDSAEKLLIAVTNPLRKAKIGDWALYAQHLISSFGLLDTDIKYVVTDVTETDITLEETRFLKEPVKSPPMTIKFEQPNGFMHPAEHTFKQIATTDETVNVNEKQFETQCTEFETATLLQGKEVILRCKIWTSADGPLDGMVRFERATGDQKLLLELKDYGRGK